MINLLPPTERLALTHLRLNRATNIVGVGCLVIFGLTALALVLFKSGAQLDIIRTEEGLKNLYEDPAVIIVLRSDQAIASFNNQLKTIAAVAAGQRVWSRVLTTIAVAAPPGVRLNGINLAARDGQQLTVTGVSDTRLAMLAFQTALARADLGKIESPLTNFVTDRAISFSLVITLDP